MTRRAVVPIGLALVAASLWGCSRPSPRILSWEMWEPVDGTAASVQVFPEADGTLRLAKGKLYLVRVTLRTAGKEDRCIYDPVSDSWTPSLRQFYCWPETSETLVVDGHVPTWRFDVDRVTRHSVSIGLTECVTDTREVTYEGGSETHPVVWRE